MAKILFVNPPLRKSAYLVTNTSVAAPSYPSLTLANLAGQIRKNHQVQILDLELVSHAEEALWETIDTVRPDFVASSANTPSYLFIANSMKQIKERYPWITTIVGGVHITALPGEAAQNPYFDIIVLGEGDKTIEEILEKPLSSVAGVMYFDSQKKRVSGKKREYLKDLDALAYPAWNLFSLKQYKNSRVSCRKNPAGLIETSRGCAFQCNFCNKLTFGTLFRVKSPRRVVDEIEYMLQCGFKEIHITDDSFTQDIGRAKEVCAEILRRNLKFPWSILNGVRADKVDQEFFMLAKRSGCWQTGFGIESGDDAVLQRISKQITTEQIQKSIRMAKNAGIETFGFFIFGLSGESIQSMQKTIDFACELPLDIAKFDICIPYPGTPYYNELKSQNRLASEDWSKYVCHQIDEPLFQHENISWQNLQQYYRQAFRIFYLRPRYIIQRFLRDLCKGDFLYDLSYFLRAKW